MYVSAFGFSDHFVKNFCDDDTKYLLYYLILLIVGIICPPPRYMGSLAMNASNNFIFTLRIGSSHSGPSRVDQRKPCIILFLQSFNKFLFISDGNVSFMKILGLLFILFPLVSLFGPNAHIDLLDN